jgi:hypothetical protein
MGHQGFIRAFVVEPITPISLVQSGEDLVRFVDHGEIERRDGSERGCAALAAREFPADKVDAGREKARIVLACLDAE